jgi:type II secretory pathway component GspD/PulD (secretin)
MFIVPSVKDTSTSSFLNSGTTYFKDPEERSTRTTVRIKDGETVIIGGLIRNDSSETTKKVPFLGDIPVLGALFRHKNKDRDRERELLIFITPHIIKESPIELAKTNNLPEKNLLLEREQQPSESLIERKQSINTSLSKFER